MTPMISGWERVSAPPDPISTCNLQCNTHNEECQTKRPEASMNFHRIKPSIIHSHSITIKGRYHRHEWTIDGTLDEIVTLEDLALRSICPDSIRTLAMR